MQKEEENKEVEKEVQKEEAVPFGMNGNTLDTFDLCRNKGSEAIFQEMGKHITETEICQDVMS